MALLSRVSELAAGAISAVTVDIAGGGYAVRQWIRPRPHAVAGMRASPPDRVTGLGTYVAVAVKRVVSGYS